MSKADPSSMRPQDENRAPIDGHLFDLLIDRIEAPLGDPGNRRRQLLAELRSLIERDEYRVAPDAVADAIVRESGVFIDWQG